MLAAIALGSNLPSRFGSPADNLHEALRRLATLGRLTAISTFHETDPIGYTDQPRFLNAAALLETELSPLDLLHAILAIEHAMGRDRASGPPKGPRLIDLDLLLYRDETGDTILNTPELTLPHPSLHERSFVLAPLAEIAPNWQHPLLHRSIAQLTEGLASQPSKPRSSALWPWLFTALNLLVLIVFAVLVLGVFAALAAFAAGIEPWATNTIRGLFFAGMVLAILALRSSRRVRSVTKRRVMLMLNALPLILYGLALAWFFNVTLHTTRRHIILPEGFQGEVYLMHIPHQGVIGEKHHFYTTYAVPGDGILVTSDPAPSSWFEDTYMYREPNGQLKTLHDFPPGTMPDTPQNRANNTTFGVYFPRTGPTTVFLNGPGRSQFACSANFDEVWVGTPATLLRHYRSTDIEAYLKAHPELCMARK
jgi:2-amino-4-hydroxy-6-hydroxymethyldihydropteridine diphosphokinase